jgi:hypothetical protein
MRIMPLTLVRIVLALSILSMQGCAGVMVVANQTATRENPAISSCKGLIADLVAESPIPVTELLNHWGAPDRSERISLTREKWTYNLGIRFNGLILGVGVAIPLCVPVGHHYIAFTVENGNVILAEAKHSQFYGAMCNGVYCNSKSKLEDNALPERLTEYHKSRLLNLPWNTIEPANLQSLSKEYTEYNCVVC